MAGKKRCREEQKHILTKLVPNLFYKEPHFRRAISVFYYILRSSTNGPLHIIALHFSTSTFYRISHKNNRAMIRRKNERFLKEPSRSFLCFLELLILRRSQNISQQISLWIKHVVKGRCKKKRFFWDFVPNIGPHPPTAHVWDSTK